MFDLRSWIADNSAAKHGGFAGAVFFTYSLNLNFFEQIIAPALDRAGCANVLIVTDPDGYNSALDLGARSLSGVGRRYVVVPLQRRGYGIQHAKLLLMAGEKRGRLMIGSGNLTHYGYGRNLELVTCFDFDAQKDSPSTRYPFQSVWKLIQSLDDDNLLSTSASRQLAVLREKAAWLHELSSEPIGLQIGHNRNTSILAQLESWRSQQVEITAPLQSLYVIAPYYDHDVDTFRRLEQEFSPQSLHLWVDPSSTNLDGQRLFQTMKNVPSAFNAFGIQGKTEKGAHRSLHAKALIGIESSGAWCLTGSANISRPAMQRSWLGGGNLELVTFHWQTSQDAFDYLLDDPNIIAEQIDVRTVEETEEEPSERPLRDISPLIIKEAILDGHQLQLTLSAVPADILDEAFLQFLRTDSEIQLVGVSSHAITVELPQTIPNVEAVRVKIGELISPYCWIDQPAELERYGARAYYQRVKSQIETFDGAAKLFEELLNYLWERVDPQEIVAEADDDQDTTGRARRRASRSVADVDANVPPPAESFITDEELVETIHWTIDGQYRYDRSIMSLRELLSLVLLRLTTPTQEGEEVTEPNGADRQLQPEASDREVQRVQAQEALRRYALTYCKRYGKRLANTAFVKEIGPWLLFQNHFTLGRVLLEITRKSDIFTREDLEHCFWYVWAPLVWPEIVGFNGVPTLKVLEDAFGQEMVQSQWHETGMPTMTIIITSFALGQPHSSDTHQQVQSFLVARDLLRRLQKRLGRKVLLLQTHAFNETLGIEDDIGNTVFDPNATFISYNKRTVAEQFLTILHYLPPAEYHLRPLIRLAIGEVNNSLTDDESNRLRQKVYENGLQSKLEAWRQHPAKFHSITEGQRNCPVCYGRLPVVALNKLRHRELVLCPLSQEAWLYECPKLPDKIVH